MQTFEKLSRLEQVLLLAFLPLLGATAHMSTALVAGVICIAASWSVRASARLLPASLESATRWSLYAALGFGIAYLVSALAIYLLPVPGEDMIYLHLTGLSPLVFLWVSPVGRNREAPGGHLLYACVLLFVFSLIRESLGRGTLLGYPLWTGHAMPIGILASSAGALILFGTTAWGNALWQDARDKRNDPEGRA